MNYALVVFVFSLMVPQAPEVAGSGPFATLEECQAEAAKVPETVANYNASGNPVKIHYYAAECVPLKVVPKGKEV